MKVTLRKDYQYYLPFIFGGLLFIIIFYYLVLDNKGKVQSPEQVLSKVKNGDKLIVDPELAKIAQNIPLVLGDETSTLDTIDMGEPVGKTVEIKDATVDLVEIIDSNTIITFKNSTDKTIILVGSENTWRAEIAVGEAYSQIFQKTGQFKFTINDKPIGVVRVR